jgi:hypothetical protein
MKRIESIFSILAMLGALLVSNQVQLGWILWLVSSILGTLWGIKTKNYWVAGMQGFFSITNLIGLVNYCL